MIRQQVPSITEVLEDPCTHYHLKDALRVFLTKDPVDAVNDAELLLDLLKAKLQNVLAGFVLLIPLVTVPPTPDVPLMNTAQTLAPTCIDFCQGGN